MKWFTRNKEHRPITEKTIRDVSDDNDNPVTFASGLEDSEREKELEEFGDGKKSDFNINDFNEDEFNLQTKQFESKIDDIEETIRDIQNSPFDPDDKRKLEKLYLEKEQLEHDLEKHKNQYKTVKEEEKIWDEIEEEIKDIEKDKNVTLDDKIILLYKIYDEYKETMPRELTQRILIDLASLDEKLQEMKKEEGLKAKDEKLHDKIKTLKQRLDEKRLKSRNIPVKSTDDLSPAERKKVESKSHEKIEDWEHTASLLLLEAESM